MADELIPVNIIVADRRYRLKIAPRDEEKHQEEHIRSFAV